VSIPVATHTISIQRPQATDLGEDIWERSPAGDPAPTVASNIRANIEPNRLQAAGPGETQTAALIMSCDPCDLTFRDLITDQTGQTYAVEWAIKVPGLPGLAHIQAGLNYVTGFGND
jgi:hypothetical protein